MFRFLKNLTCLFLLIVISGCTPKNKKTVQLSSPFNAEKAKRMIQPGPNTIKGSAVIRQQAGGTVHCGGKEVLLIPATQYAAERIRYLYKSGTEGYNPNRQANFSPNPKEYWELMRRTTCDAQGNFTFRNVADGTFYVSTAITWYVSEYGTQGGALMKRIQLSDGETENIVLAP